MSLKQKTISSLIWSFIDTLSGQGIQFIAGIMLARILSPREFGLVGMISIFIAIPQSFINSGFSQALIRKKSCTQIDYSTVFFFNLAVGISLFLMLYAGSSEISKFFHEPELELIIQVLGSILIIESFTIIQRTILTKRIDFKLQARISIIASTVAGIVALTLAWLNFGVWSLVALSICKQMLNSGLLWLWNRWKPALVFSSKSFRELFGFGSKLLVSGLIDTVYQNVYYLIIGKYFSAQELGFYTRADQFKNLTSQNMTSVIQRVTYPVMASIQDDASRLRNSYRHLIRSSMFITFILMFGMVAVAKPMILSLIGEQWSASIVYLQMLCFAAVLYPLHALNLNMLQVQGRSDLFLKLEIIKKILAVPVIVIGVIWGIKVMIFGMIVNSIIAYYLNSFWSGQLIGYSFSDQVKDILPAFFLAIFINGIVYLTGQFLTMPIFLIFLLQVFTGFILTISICEIIKFRDYIYLKQMMLEYLPTIKLLRYGAIK
jgi:O-antigen/teichoic acid export membrane protein